MRWSSTKRNKSEQQKTPTKDEKELMKTHGKKALLDVAKDKALQVWIEKEAWRPVDRSEAGEGELIPARMLGDHTGLQTS